MSGVRTTVYLNRVIADALRRAYPEAKTLGEAVQLFIYEVLAGVVEHREFDSEAVELARALAEMKRLKLNKM